MQKPVDKIAQHPEDTRASFHGHVLYLIERDPLSFEIYGSYMSRHAYILLFTCVDCAFSRYAITVLAPIESENSPLDDQRDSFSNFAWYIDLLINSAPIEIDQ